MNSNRAQGQLKSLKENLQTRRTINIHSCLEGEGGEGVRGAVLSISLVGPVAERRALEKEEGIPEC